MRIACPGCAAEYEVPASRLPPRKMVRCAQCGGEWIAVREAVEDVREPEAAAVPEPAPEPEPTTALPFISAMDRLTASAPPPRSHAGLIGAWILTCVVLAATAAATIVWRGDIIATWPPSSRILAPHGQTVAVPVQSGVKKAD